MTGVDAHQPDRRRTFGCSLSRSPSASLLIHTAPLPTHRRVCDCNTAREADCDYTIAHSFQWFRVVVPSGLPSHSDVRAASPLRRPNPARHRSTIDGCHRATTGVDLTNPTQSIAMDSGSGPSLSPGGVPTGFSNDPSIHMLQAMLMQRVYFLIYYKITTRKV